MKKLVISGINLFEGGPLSIYYDCLDEIIRLGFHKKYYITAFVHDKSLFKKYNSLISFIELPKSRNNYLFRLYYEYFFFYKYSLGKKIDIWISLHDITPKVKAKKIYTYCHNPSPFMKKDIKKAKYSLTNVLFSFFYKYLYRINIKKATGIIVQQDWMRKEFLKMYPIKNVIVARPSINLNFAVKQPENRNGNTINFMFAAYPRYFKNFEVICEACKFLEKERIEVWLTIDGTENRYSADLKNKYGKIKNIKWLGTLSRNQVFDLYNKTDYLIFPSVLETWGLPISEFKSTGKGMILADLPYAHEALGSYDKVKFFNPYNGKELATILRKVINNQKVFYSITEEKVKDPYASNWQELIKLLLS